MEKAEASNTQEFLRTIYNTHAHCFTIDHVPNYFVGWLLPISWLRKSGALKWLIKKLPLIPFFNHGMMKRLANLLIYADKGGQEDVIKKLLNYYPAKSKFVLLTMDMEYMDAGAPKEPYLVQLDKLAKIKKNISELSNNIFPFIFVDPRRIEADPSFIEKIKENIELASYQGIKLYPPIGYYPFDKNLREVYRFALEYNVPITTHCIRGVVHYRGKNIWQKHPITGQLQPGTRANEYANNLAHPLNYECLLNADLLKNVWGTDATSLKSSNKQELKIENLKICLAHFGGEDEWDRFMVDPWLPGTGLTGSDGNIDIDYPWFESKIDKRKPFSWFSVICNLINSGHYPNLYADISYTLCDPATYPLLKLILESSKNIREHILFGTDYFVVAKEGTERELCINLRGYIGEELFRQIAETNPMNFLKNKFNSDI